MNKYEIYEVGYGYLISIDDEVTLYDFYNIPKQVIDIIKQLEQENKELHNKIDNIRELVENSDWRLDDVHDLIDGYNEIEEILKDSDVDECE